MLKKRKRITLNSEDMPDEIYEILNEKALNRRITPYIIQLVQQRINDKVINDKLDLIEAKIDKLAYGNIIIKNSNIEEGTLKEGILVQANSVIGKIDEEDKIEYDL